MFPAESRLFPDSSAKSKAIALSTSRRARSNCAERTRRAVSSFARKPVSGVRHPAEHEPSLGVSQLDHDRWYRQFLIRAVHNTAAEREIFLTGREFAALWGLRQVE